MGEVLRLLLALLEMSTVGLSWVKGHDQGQMDNSRAGARPQPLGDTASSLLHIVREIEKEEDVRSLGLLTHPDFS